MSVVDPGRLREAIYQVALSVARTPIATRHMVYVLASARAIIEAPKSWVCLEYPGDWGDERPTLCEGDECHMEARVSIKEES